MPEMGTAPKIPENICTITYNRNFSTNGTGGFSNHAGTTIASLTASASTVMLFEVQGAVADVTNAGASSGGYDGTSPAGNGTATGVSAGAPYGSLGAGGSPVYATGLFRGAPAGMAATTYSSSQPVHTGGANYCFADGHVKYMISSNVSAGTDNTSGDCGVWPGDFTASNGQHAVSANQINNCTGGGPFVTFSLH